MKDKKDFVKRVWAFTLGDGCLRRIKGNGNSCYKLCQVDTHKDYVEWQASILEDLTKVNIYYDNPRLVEKTGNLSKGRWHLETRSHPLYTKMRNNIYPLGVKIVNPHYLKLLDWQVMAILFQDDGSLPKESTNRRQRAKIATCSFSYGDNLLLREAIKEKLDVIFNVYKYKKYYFLQASPNNTETFIKGITPYILPSFEYKINLSCNE